MLTRPQADLSRFAETQNHLSALRSPPIVRNPGLIDKCTVGVGRAPVRKGRQFPGNRESTTGFGMVERDE